MNAGSAAPSVAELVDEISTWTVGGGIITMALFPLALPALVLTVIAALPLLAAVLAAGLLIGAVALPVLLIRGAIRALGRMSHFRLAIRVTDRPPRHRRDRRRWPQLSRTSGSTTSGRSSAAS